jgi:hypothetical protein
MSVQDAELVRSYRKRPVVIEAALLTADNVSEVAAWCHARTANPSYLNISTLEGIMRADLGDYVIRGIKGEFYPCKPDIFEASYERQFDGDVSA